jgi:phage shock protein C
MARRRPRWHASITSLPGGVRRPEGTPDDCLRRSARQAGRRDVPATPPDHNTAGPSWYAVQPGAGTPPGYGTDYQPRRLYRSLTNRSWAGVCGGLAEHFGWDAGATRAIYAILTVFTGIFPMLVLYVVMAVFIPNGPAAGTAGASAHASAAYPAGVSTGPSAAAIVLGVLLIVGGAIALRNRYFFIDWNDLGPAAAIGLGLVVIGIGATRRR